MGQGDCTLFVTPKGKTILIDAGEKSASDTIINYIRGQGIHKIDVIIATHPHADHIGVWRIDQGIRYRSDLYAAGDAYDPNI